MPREPSGDGLRVEGLTVGYGKAPVLEDFAISVPAGRVVAVVGPNGAGKSTLVRTIAGLLRPAAGSVRFDGESLVGRRPEQVARRGVLMVPETRDIFGGMTVWENLKVAFDNLDPGGDERAAFERVETLFPILAERRRQLAGNLSGGQQQMLAIARALLGRPKLLMLDEPSLGLARIVIRDIYAALRTLREQGLTVLLVEQNATMAVEFADRSLVLVNGRVVLEGPRETMSGNDALVRHYLGGAPTPV
ncbi:MAG TPA: ABC transporter ATP-binding protein [Burkholderiaceae bacterium]|nr:ABC transporter ATP-binding protein [Burkholderiaceae bacterium]